MAEASTNGHVAATEMGFVAGPDGLRVGGRTYREGERVPAKYGRAVKAAGDVAQDPAWNSSMAPPNLGRVVVPNIYTYGSMQSLISKTYRNPDEALRHNLSNARAMTKDLVIWECIEARQRGTVLLDWHLEAEDKNDPTQKQLVEDLTRIVASIRDFTEYRRNLMDALWYGRNGIQNQYGFMHRGGKRWTVIDDWKPINGDKLVFRYDDGSGTYDPNQVGIKTTYLHSKFDAVAGDRKVETTEQGPAYFLEKWERPLWAIHKHMIEDGLYEDVLSAGRVHGVGIRDRIYWTWYQKQEALAMMMELVERTGNGFTVYYYQYGNPEAQRKMEEIARNHGTNNRILIPRLVGDPSMDSNGIEVIPANTAGIDALKELVHEFFGHQIKRYILGQILSSESASTGLGSGVADLHMESFLQIIKYDARKLEETITREVIEPLKRFNFPWARDIPVWFRIDTESTEPERKLQAVKNAWEMGAKIKASDVMSLIGLSMPTEEDEILQNPQLARAGAQLMHEQRLGQAGMAPGDDPGDGDGSQSYDPSNLDHLFGPALKAAGVASGSAGGDGASTGPGPGNDGKTARFARARYKINHAPEGGAGAGGKEYAGGQFVPEGAAAKGKEDDAAGQGNKGMPATADQQALESGMMKHGFIDKPITDADRAGLWEMARANVGDPAIPKDVRGMFVTLQMLKETQQMGVATTDKIDPKVAGGIYGWLKSNVGKDVGGGHVRDLGNGKLGFSAKAGALILAPKAGGRFDATYSSMTHVVRSAGGAGGGAQNFDVVREDDGYGPELGAEEMQVDPTDQGDGYGPEIDIETIDGDAEENGGIGVPAGHVGDQPGPSREPGDEEPEDDDGYDPNSGFYTGPRDGGKSGGGAATATKSKPINKRSEIGKLISATAEEYAVGDDDLGEAVEHVWNMHRERLDSREAAKSAVRQWFGITQRDINRLENQGKDHTALKGFDVIARAAAGSYPELGIGMGRVDLGEGAAKEDEGLEEALWNALKEGKVTPPSRKELVREAAEWLSKGHGLAKKEQEEMEAVPFKKRLEEMFVAKYGQRRLFGDMGSTGGRQQGFNFESSAPLTDSNGHLHAPKGGATVNGKDFEGGEFIPPGDVAAATDEEKKDLKNKQVEAIAESMQKAKAGGGETNLFGDEVREKPKPTTFENNKAKQNRMFSGMDSLSGQEDLFDDLDKVNDDTVETIDGNDQSDESSMKTIEANLEDVDVFFDPHHSTSTKRVKAIIDRVRRNQDEDGNDEIVWDLPPIVVIRSDGNGHKILDGHHRAEAAKKLGLSEIPAWVVEREDFDRLVKDEFDEVEPNRLWEIREQIKCGDKTANEITAHGDDVVGNELREKPKPTTDDGEASEVNDDPDGHEKKYGLHQGKSGNWGFRGHKDARLMWVNKDGGEPTDDQLAKRSISGPAFVGLKDRGFPTREAALDASYGRVSDTVEDIPEDEPETDADEPEVAAMDDADVDEGAPWQMTAEEWKKQGGDELDHTMIMTNALREGKPVPEHVLDSSSTGRWRALKSVFDWQNSLTPEQTRLRSAKATELTEDEFLEKQRLSRIADQLCQIPQREAELKQLGPKDAKKRQTAETLRDHAREELERYRSMPHGAHDSNKNGAAWRRIYEATIREGISKGLISDPKIINQRPEFKTALTARQRYEKGRHTSFANKSIAVDSSMRAERGYKAKRQDGKEMTDSHRKSIEAGISEVEQVLGPLKDLFEHTDLTIAHTSGKHPFLSQAGGLYSPSERTVTTGHSTIFGQTKALAHELAHWLDYEAGNITGARGRVYNASYKGHDVSAISAAEEHSGKWSEVLQKATRSMNNMREVKRLVDNKLDKDATDEEKAKAESYRVHLGRYWRQPHEIFARLAEQYIAESLGGNAKHAADADYSSQPGWWSAKDFAEYRPVIKAEIERRIQIIRDAAAAKQQGGAK
jgi:phage gp29-like protein